MKYFKKITDYMFDPMSSLILKYVPNKIVKINEKNNLIVLAVTVIVTILLFYFMGR